MVYLVGIAVVAAFIGARWLTMGWKPGDRQGQGRGRRTVTTLYATRSVVSVALLAAAFAYLLAYAAETPALFQPVRGPLAVVPSAIGILFSMLVLAQVARANRLVEFLGLSPTRKVLFVNGMFSLCRHPMYAGWLLAIWGLLLSEPYALTVLVGALISTSFLLEALREERAMAESFGDYYRQYQARVPFLIPYGFKRAGSETARAIQPAPSEDQRRSETHTVTIRPRGNRSDGTAHQPKRRKAPHGAWATTRRR